MSFRKAVFAVAIISFLFSSVAFANNLSITNGDLVDQVSGSDTIQIQFDISWENSWHDATNYDAVWVFAKYCTENCTTSGTWLHATMKTAGTNPAGVSQGTGTGLDIVVPTDKKGAFLQRSANGTGTVTTTGVELVWDYGADGVSDSDAGGANTQVKIFGIEMVYIPEASFKAGDGSEGSALNPATNGFKQGSSCRDPWVISSESAISVTAAVSCSASNYYYTSGAGTGELASGAVFTIPDDFPKGYQAFYVMKYELSAGGFRDFLNTLARDQQNNHVQGNITSDTITNTYVMSNTPVVSSYRNPIRVPASGNGTTNPITFGCDLNQNGVFDEAGDGEWIAINYVLWKSLAAYADWAALRPMTELEFEKAARGTLDPVNLEYAWGTASVVYSNALVSMGFSDEMSGTANAYCSGNTTTFPQGARRCGMFATATSTRILAGASYYGVLDLSGNVYELVVTVGNATGYNFDGSHGDGVLSAAGYGTNSLWPGYVTGQISGNVGQGVRGGYWNSTTMNRTSDRAHAANYASYTAATTPSQGLRCVRTAE